MRNQITALAAGLLATTLGFATAAQATTLSTTMTVDNYFSAYISTDNSVLGTLIGSGTDWSALQSFNSPLTSFVTNYLHIVAGDTGPPSMFIGTFALNDTNFQFANGGQTLVTDTPYWTASRAGFGIGTPFDAGLNGTSPWGTFEPVGASAHFIWLDDAYSSGTVFFSTPIFSTQVTQEQGVPEPLSLVLFALGLFGFGVLLQRRAT